MSETKTDTPRELELVVGGVYRAKRPRKMWVDIDGPVYNDRTILWMSDDGGRLQYDGPAVGVGRHYPKVSREQFLKWAGRRIEATPNQD